MKKHSFSIFALAISFCLALCACHTNYIDEPYPTDTDKEVSEDDILKTIGADFDPNGQHIDYTLAPNAHLSTRLPPRALSPTNSCFQVSTK